MSLSSAERQRSSVFQQMETSIGASSTRNSCRITLNWTHLQRFPSGWRRFFACSIVIRWASDKTQAGYRQLSGSWADLDNAIGADLPPEGRTDEPEAEWEPEPEANWEPEPEPEPKQKQPKYEWPTYEQPVDLDEAPWEPQNEKGKPKRKTADEQAYEKALDEARAAHDAATSDELTVMQRVVAVVVKLAIAIPLMFATKWFFKNALTPTQALVVSVLGLTGMTVWWIVRLIRRLNTKTALRHEKAWRRSYIGPHSIKYGMITIMLESPRQPPAN
jgi:hypothetical protein